MASLAEIGSYICLPAQKMTVVRVVAKQLGNLKIRLRYDIRQGDIIIS